MIKKYNRCLWLIGMILTVGACQKEADQVAKQGINKFSDETIVSIYEAQDKRDTKALLGFFNDDNDDYREEAALAFGSVQDSSAIPHLSLLLVDRSAKVRKAAAYSLGQTSDSSVVGALVAALAEEDTAVVRKEMIEALGKVVTMSDLIKLQNQLSENDLEKGEWTYYFETGEIEAAGLFKNGLKTGIWTYYHKNGLTAATGSYEKGLRIGDWVYYHDNGQVSQEGTLIEDQKDGYWKLFYPSGEIQGEVEFSSGTGSFSEYYPSGSRKSKGQIVDGKKTGLWTYYNESGLLEGEAEFVAGEGDYIGYYQDRTIKMKGRLKDDKRVGEWILYNEDGSKAGTYHPIYEDEKPIFKTRISRDETERTDFNTPEYRFKRRGFKYFEPTINEYKGLIIGSNPGWLFVNELPIAVEYYIQERLGHEVQVDLIRDPFFTPNTQIDDNRVYLRGSNIHLRQKFYNSDGPNGMFYFGHEVSIRFLDHRVNHLDTANGAQATRRFGSMTENGLGYGIFVGNRWMKDAGNSGWTVDIFFGVGISARSYNKKYLSAPAREVQIFDNYFQREIDSRVSFPIQIGLNIGFVSPKSKSKTQ